MPGFMTATFESVFEALEEAEFLLRGTDFGHVTDDGAVGIVNDLFLEKIEFDRYVEAKNKLYVFDGENTFYKWSETTILPGVYLDVFNVLNEIGAWKTMVHPVDYKPLILSSGNVRVAIAPSVEVEGKTLELTDSEYSQLCDRFGYGMKVISKLKEMLETPSMDDL